MSRVGRRGLAAIVVAVLLVGAGSAAVVYRLHNARMPLDSAAVGIGANGAAQPVLPGDKASFFPGTRVLRAPGAAAAQLAAQQRQWLASGQVPGATGPYGEMVRQALLDLHTLMVNGAPIAAWRYSWHYVWPRDAAYVAVALAGTGHQGDAVQVLSFLQQVQPVNGVFAARYLPDESGRVPSPRGEESDGVGWALWATAETASRLSGRQRTAMLHRLAPLIERSTSAAMTLTQGPDALPPPSLDYWELPDERLSLGTAGPIAFGLRAAAELQSELGNESRAAEIRARQTALNAGIRSAFGADGYPRYRGTDKSDASISYLLPPFTDAVDDGALKAWQRAIPEMRRPAGGLAPGADWRNDGVSWTPATAMFALTAAASGQRSEAIALLDWLNTHRTTLGALPEKVLSNGQPAGPAPLVITAALAVLTVAQLDR